MFRVSEGSIVRGPQAIIQAAREVSLFMMAPVMGIPMRRSQMLGRDIDTCQYRYQSI